MQRPLSRCKPGSKRRQKRGHVLVWACYCTPIRRHNAIHRLTSEFVTHHGKWITLEDLDIKAMTAKISVSDSSKKASIFSLVLSTRMRGIRELISWYRI